MTDYEDVANTRPNSLDKTILGLANEMQLTISLDEENVTLLCEGLGSEDLDLDKRVKNVEDLY